MNKELYVYVLENPYEYWRGMIQVLLKESELVKIESDYGTKHYVNKNKIFINETLQPIEEFMAENNITNIITEFKY